MSAPKKRPAGGHSHGGARRRGGHDEEHAEHENEERWLLTYADMITLLMVLFIVMFAMSQVDQHKFMALKTGLAAGFGAPVAMLSGGTGMLDVGGSIAPDSINLAGQAGGKGSSSTNDTINPAAVAQLASATEQAQVAQEAQKLQAAQKALQQALQQAGLKSGATFRYDERGLVVTIATDKVLFASGSAVLLPEGETILDALAPVLRSLPNKLSVDGHTNSLPIDTAQFPSNWELSTIRATGVLRYLAAHDNIPVTRMSATGFADTHPLVTGDSPRAMVVNRRVEIVVIAAVDDAAGRAIASIGSGSSGSGGG
jgi:chemotaxis protein MotB